MRKIEDCLKEANKNEKEELEGRLEAAKPNHEKEKKKLEEDLRDANSKHEKEKQKLERLLSDRNGNLALLYLEMNDFGKAFGIIDKVSL